MNQSRAGVLILLLPLAGCGELHLAFPEPATPTPTATAGTFDTAQCGAVEGVVAWTGARPTPTLCVSRIAANGAQSLELPNPNALPISADGGVAGAVVYLAGVAPGAAAPREWPTVRVVADDQSLRITSGNDTPARVGFVPVGGSASFATAGDDVLGIRGRGADHFTLMMPRNTSRTFPKVGRIELTSPANVYWAASELFVCEHPYYALTDAHGKFRFDRVPAGTYELVCDIPSPEPAGRDRDPENGTVSRWHAGPRLVRRTPVRIDARGTAAARLEVGR